MKNRCNSFLLVSALLLSGHASAGSNPFTTNDNLIAPINSDNATLDVLNNDNSGILGDDFKEVVAVCDVRDDVSACTGNSYSDGTGTVTVNGSGDGNNVRFSSNNNASYVFEFKYIMQNSDSITRDGDVVVNASVIEVNSLADGNENGCNATNCTLREALTFAVNDNEESNIGFNPSLNGTITLNGSGLVIDSNDLSIVGPGPSKITVSGNNLFRVITIPFGTERFSMSGLTISNGQSPNAENGGGVLLENALQTSFENIRVINSTASGSGGGIYASSSNLTLINSEISNNSAGISGGGMGITGSFGSDVTIENTTISSNSSNNTGGGIYINSSFGQTSTLKFVTSAFNTSNSNIDNSIQGSGNVIIEASIFEPGLSIPNNSNSTNNSIIVNVYTGSLAGENNITPTAGVLNPALSRINNSGQFVHQFSASSLAYNHVDNTTGVASCGNQINTDQLGQNRPAFGTCDAGAFEYSGVIFTNNFE